MVRPTIAIFPEEEVFRRQPLLKALSDLFSVEFVGKGDLDRKSCNGALLFGIERQQAIAVVKMGVRSLAFIKDGPAVSFESGAMVRFAPSPSLWNGLRGRALPDKKLDEACHLEMEAGDELLARKGNAILWLRHNEGDAIGDLVAMEPPDLTDDGYLFEHFQKEDWMRLLPLFHFLREVSGWALPPVRACFMFDDPNLHWKTYGFVNYAELACQAARHNYHVSFATVPLDGWYVHAETAALFRKNKDRLSLLIHGNNHTAFELAQAQTESECQALAVQALRRVKRMEEAAGLEIPIVMAAPHGACNHSMARVLLRTDFEAACISRGSIMHHNPSTDWPGSVGLNPAEFLGAGLPVIPRFRLEEGCDAEMIMAAFLGQPVIPVGHHEDLADGPDLLAQLADTLNSIGEVQWSDMKAMARSNFCTRHDREVLHVRMYSRKIHLKVPSGVSQLCIHRPWLDESASEGLTLRPAMGHQISFASYSGEPISTGSCKELEIHAVPADAINRRNISLPRTSLWAVTRRQLCESRDRLKPLVNGLLVRKQQPK